MISSRHPVETHISVLGCAEAGEFEFVENRWNLSHDTSLERC